ncbi:hypothetical protein ADUPG1_012468 [Aduncisulcus paluster]|uniref:Uncharacterized protein n=1 Tax=Aduncisulcus paluster TaxID=2918883 RepID=A0ABQ5K388_9EUKA|nr:hypothetical protein ADUPG1_012468 [Aduncisulcus paluster]
MQDLSYGYQTILDGHRHAVTALKFSPKSNVLASGSLDGAIFLWNIGMPSKSDLYSIKDLKTFSSSPMAALIGHQAGITGLDWSVDGSILYSSSDDGTVKAWSLSKAGFDFYEYQEKFFEDWPSHPTSETEYKKLHQKLTKTISDYKDPALLFTFVPTLASSASSTSGKPKTVNIRQTCVSVCKDPSKHIIVSGGIDGSCRLWDVRTQECYQVCLAHTKAITDISFNPKFHNQFISSSLDGTIRVWDSAGTPQKSLLGPRSRIGVSSIDISPNGKYLLASTFDSVCRLWNIGAGQVSKIFQSRHQCDTYIIKCGFAPNVAQTQWACTGSQNGNMVLYSIKNPKLYYRFNGVHCGKGGQRSCLVWDMKDEVFVCGGFGASSIDIAIMKKGQPVIFMKQSDIVGLAEELKREKEAEDMD